MNWLFWLVTGLYLFFCLFYAWAQALRAGSLQQGLFCLVLSLALPVVGPLLFWFCVSRGRQPRREDYKEFYRGTVFRPDDLRRLQRPDVTDETDRIPMEEALAVSDKSYRRRMVMQLLNVEDPLAYLPVLRRALANEDGETSHYASVAIMELRRKVQQQLDDARDAWRRAPRDPRICENREELLYRVLQTDLFDSDVRRRLLKEYCALSDRMLRAEHPTGHCLHHRVRMELTEGRTETAQQICTRYLTLYPDSEQAVRDQLALCVHTKSGSALQDFLGDLRRRPVLLTSRTLALVRAFRKEGPREQRS